MDPVRLKIRVSYCLGYGERDDSIRTQSQGLFL